jgi:hypothetical protein
VTDSSDTTLYRLYGEGDVLLYVGISGKWPSRMSQHARSKRWWDDVVTVKREVLPTRAEALAAEGRAILDEKPLYNVSLGGGMTAPRQSTGTSVLYRAYDYAGRLLYVAATNDLDAELGRQERISTWWKYATRIETEEFRTLRAAAEQKAALVRELQPPGNRKGGGYRRRLLTA